MKNAVRITALALLVVLLGIAATGCGGSSQPAAAGKQDFTGQVLRVGLWGGAYQENNHASFGVPFEQKSGAKIEYVPGNPRDHMAKILAAKGMEPPMDVVFLDESTQTLAAAQGLLEKVDDKQVPNIAKLLPNAYLNPGFGPIVHVTQLGIAYNTQKFKELGLKDPPTIDVLWDPKLAGRVALPSINTVMGIYALIAANHMVGSDEKNFEAGLKKLSEIKLFYIYPSSFDLQDRFTSGEVWAAYWIDGSANTYGSKGAAPVNFVAPPSGKYKALSGADTVDIVTGTKKRKLAEFYMNEALAGPNQVKIAELGFWGPSSSEAATLLKNNPKLSKLMVLDPEAHKQLYRPDFKYVNDSFNTWVDAWNRSFKTK